ncbi:hypothetical protein WMY93_018290 [Mugilogobius chulae]|uniref:Uncharacterized protein n=1 Tax=Mugilogobius chulae TaxID=88201 RepID=A0AAW0NIR0_9GOBI
MVPSDRTEPSINEEATDMSHRRNFNQNKMRAAVQAPSAEFSSQNREDRMKLIDCNGSSKNKDQRQASPHQQNTEVESTRPGECSPAQEALQNKVEELQKELTEATELNEIRQNQLQKEQEEGSIYKDNSRKTAEETKQKLLSVESALTEQRKTAEDATNKLLSVESALAEQKKTAEEAKNKLLSVESALAEEKKTVEEAKNKLSCGEKKTAKEAKNNSSVWSLLSLRRRRPVKSALTEQKQAAEAASKKASELEECLNMERTRVQALQGDLDTQTITFKAVLEKSSCAQHALETTLVHSEKERTSALLRCEELELSLKHFRDQLQQSQAIVEELQVELTEKKRKKRRRWFKWCQ